MPNIEIAVIVMKDAVNVLITKPIIGPDTGKWILPMDRVNEGEKLIEAAERIVKDQCGLSTIPKRILFPVEVVEPNYHHVILVGFSECASSGDPQPAENYLSAAQFVDPRSLGDYQNEGMAVWTAQAFANFSMILMAQASAATKSGIV
jgi:ADP-ribose pyrophosphatase YjhB (NUDIX family)